MSAPIKLMRTVLSTAVAGGGGAGATGSSAARTTVQLTTASLANNGTETDWVAMSKTFQLLVVQVSDYARVRLYSTLAARTADAGRGVGQPVPFGSMSGVIADISMTPALGILTWMMSPAALGFNDDSPARLLCE
jgi:hypothetical protein